MFRQLLRPLARIGRWPRLAAAAVCLLLAAVSALEASGRDAGALSERSSAHTVPVVVALRALPAGHLLSRRDVAIARWPTAMRPEAGFDDSRAVVGRRLAGAVAAREPLTRRRLLGADLTTGLGPDSVAVSIALDADVAHLVQAGDRVELIAAPPSDLVDSGGTASRTAETVVRSARVLAMFDRSEPATDSGGTQLVLAVNRDLALRIAALRSTRMFTVVADSP